MKKSFIILIILLIIVVIGVFVFLQSSDNKTEEDKKCGTNTDCQEGLKCVQNVCSSGSLGSPCQTKSDCQSSFCVDNKCTEGIAGSPCQTADDCLVKFCVNQKCSAGKEGDFCFTFNDCDGILCVNSACSKLSGQPNEEVFNEYLSRFRLGTVSEWPKEGPPLFEAKDVFSLGEQFCIEADVLKDITLQKGKIYDPYEEVMVVPDMGSGSVKQGNSIECLDLPAELSPGKKYEYKVYIGDILVAVLPFEVR